MLDTVMFLAAGVRRYLPTLLRIGKGQASDPIHGPSGWYVGAELEYLQVSNFNDGMVDDIDMDGSLVIPQIAVGYRLPIWRSPQSRYWNDWRESRLETG